MSAADFTLPLLAIVFLACVTNAFLLARSIVPLGDGAQAYNETVAVRSGNLLLHGWVLPPDTYILTDLPLFVLGSLALGPTPLLIYLVPVAVFAAFLVACCLLVGVGRGARWLPAFAILYLVGAQPVDPGGLLVATMHAAPLTLCLFALVAARPMLRGERLRRSRLALFGLLAFVAIASDPFCVAYLFAPLLLLVPLRSWLAPRRQRDEWLLVVVTLAALALAAVFVRLVARLGGFTVAPVLSFQLAPGLSDIWWNFYAVLRGLQAVFGARALFVPGSMAMPLIVATRNAAMILAVLLCGRMLWRLKRAGAEDMLAQVLVFGALCLLAMDTLSNQFANSRSFGPAFPYYAARYVLPAFVFACLAAARELPSVLTTTLRCRLATALLVALAVPVAAGALEAGLRLGEQPAGLRRAGQAALSDWLVAHGLRHGVGDYWTATMVDALSRGAVHTIPVRMSGDVLVPYAWLADMTDAARPPEFAAFVAGTPFGLTEARLVAAYGLTEQVWKHGDYTVLVFARPGRGK